MKDKIGKCKEFSLNCKCWCYHTYIFRAFVSLSMRYFECLLDLYNRYDTRNPNTKTSIYTTSTITVLLSESATFEACRALLPSGLHASSNVPMLMYFEFPISRSRLNFKRLGTFLSNLFRKQTLTNIVSSVFRTRL